MAQITMALSHPVEDLIKQVQQVLQENGATTDSALAGAPLGRPKTKFQLTKEQLAEVNQLAKEGKTKQAKLKTEEFQKAWAEARGKEDALREASKQRHLQLFGVSGLQTNSMPTRRPAKATVISVVLERFLPVYLEQLKKERMR